MLRPLVSPTPFFAFWALIGNKILGVVVTPQSEQNANDRIMLGWVGAVVLMFFLIFAVNLIPLPALGTSWTRIDVPGGSDLELNRPQIPLALGFLYFWGLVFFSTWFALYRIRESRGKTRRSIEDLETEPAVLTERETADTTA